MSERINHPAMSADMLKMLRTEWMDRARLCFELGCSLVVVERYVNEWMAQGLLEQRDGAKPARGFTPKEFRVAPAWIGESREVLPASAAATQHRPAAACELDGP